MSSKEISLKRTTNKSKSMPQLKQQKLTSFFKKNEPEQVVNSSQCQHQKQVEALPVSDCEQSQFSPTPSTEHQQPESSRADSVLNDGKNIQQKSQQIDLSASPDEPPTQPQLKQFPKKSMNGKLRSFSSSWFKSFPFLEYSEKLDMVFCFCCRHFSTKRASSFVCGNSDWKNMGSILSKHFVQSPDHLFSHEKYLSYLQAKEVGGVSNQVNSHHKETVIKNRSILAAHVECILYCSRQGIALRGHREDIEELGNHGHFLELLELFKRKCPDLKKNSDQLPSNSKYVHSTIQNEIINITATMIRQMIVKEIREGGGKFSLIADEARDSAGKEQLSVCVRYVFNSEIKERFLGFVEMENFGAESICAAICKIVEDSGLSLKNCVAQSYDGASVMSGDITGTQTRIEEKVGAFCPYVHCYAHKLNLVLIDSCTLINEVLELLGLLQSVYTFQSRSPRRSKYFQDSQEQRGYSTILKIPQTNDTRWSSKHKGISYFRSRLDAVILALEKIIIDGKADEIPECQGYLNRFKSFKTVFMLVIMDKVLSLTNSMSKYLQSPQMTLSTANLLSSATIKTLNDIRHESEFQKLWKATEELCTTCQILIPEKEAQGETRRRTISTRLRNSVVMETIGARVECSSYGDYRRVYFEVLDKFLHELKERFSNNDDLNMGVAACDPSCEKLLEESSVLSFCRLFSRFKFHEESIKSEILLAKNLLKSGVEMKNTLDCYNLLLKVKSSFPELLKYFMYQVPSL